MIIKRRKRRGGSAEEAAQRMQRRGCSAAEAAVFIVIIKHPKLGLVFGLDWVWQLVLLKDPRKYKQLLSRKA